MKLSEKEKLILEVFERFDITLIAIKFPKPDTLVLIVHT